MSEINQLTLGYVLIAVGFAFIFGEMVFSTHGMLLLVALCLDVIGVILVVQISDRYTGLITLAAVMLSFPLLIGLVFYLWPRSPLGRRMILRKNPDNDDTIASMPVLVELEQYRGRIGKVVSPLRPSGVVDFDGRRVDATSEGMMIDAATWVRCLDVKAGRVIVRPIEAKQLGEMDTMDFS
ncbi:MAG TPA: NfeD family protein [Gemmataceae bacterium]|jgi:membrane-bound serine protease (ClpP class)|nr:NfeD family protein [Gemmataceae bacterium]